MASKKEFLKNQLNSLQYAPQYAEAQKKVFTQYNPELYKTPEATASYLNQRISSPLGVDPALERYYTESLRSAQAARGTLRAGQSSLQETDLLTRLALEQRNIDVGNAISLSGLAPQVQFMTPQVTDYYATDVQKEESALNRAQAEAASKRSAAAAANQLKFAKQQEENRMFQWAYDRGLPQGGGSKSSKGPNPFVSALGQGIGSVAGSKFGNFLFGG